MPLNAGQSAKGNLRETLGDLIGLSLTSFMPERSAVKHAKDCERCKPRIMRWRERSMGNAHGDDGFETGLNGPCRFGNRATVGRGKMLPLAQEDTHVVGCACERFEMALDQRDQLVPAGARSIGHPARTLQEFGCAAFADKPKSLVLGAEVIIKARLTYAQDIRDVLRRGAVKSLFGKDFRSGVHDLGLAFLHVPGSVDTRC